MRGKAEEAELEVEPSRPRVLQLKPEAGFRQCVPMGFANGFCPQAVPQTWRAILCMFDSQDLLGPQEKQMLEKHGSMQLALLRRCCQAKIVLEDPILGAQKAAVLGIEVP